jgi:DNA-binding NarL/FixJ family response regulator
MAERNKQRSILIADDHELVRRGTRALLQAQKGWKVVGEAKDGREVMQKALGLRPDLVILDITMPGLDGLEAMRQIREGAPDTQVLILSMHESAQMVRRVLEAGARGYVLKSDLASHLVRAGKDVFRGKISLTPSVSEIVLSGFLKPAEEIPQVARPEGVHPTPRELEILRLLAEGKSNKEVGVALSITVRTVETHRAKIMLKLGLHSLVELVHYAARNGIVSSTGE